MAKKKREEGSGYNFMDTYGDMMTLLLTFFILLFSMSSVDSEKWEILVKAFSKDKNADTSQIIMVPPDGSGEDLAPVAGEYDLKAQMPTPVDGEPAVPQDMSQLAEAIQEYLEQNNMEEQVSVELQGENAVYLTFDNNIFFDGDSAVLRQSSYDVLNFLGGLFKSIQEEVLIVRINGHTAAIPGMDNYRVNDWDLSSMRANRVATYFEDVTTFPPKKLMTNGYGKNHPVATNETAEGRAANRRVDIQILGNDFDTEDPAVLLDVLNKTLNVDLFDESEPDPTVTAPTVPDASGSEESSEAPPAGPNGTIGSPETEIEVPIEEPPAVTEPVDDAQVEAAMQALRDEAAKLNKS